MRTLSSSIRPVSACRRLPYAGFTIMVLSLALFVPGAWAQGSSPSISLNARDTHGLTRLIVAAAAGEADTVKSLLSQGAGIGATVSIQNTGSAALTSWTLTWTFANGLTVASLCNGIESQSGANVTVKNEPYNGTIAAGATYTGMGFNGTWNGTTNAVPISFAVNGTTCQ